MRTLIRQTSQGRVSASRTDQHGASGVEYAILVTLIAVVVVVAVAFMGREVGSDFACTASAVEDRPNVTSC